MSRQIALDEYAQALRQGQKEYRELLMAGKPAHPAVLDEILSESLTETVVDIGTLEIPAERIVGTKSAGRITAFTATFRPLLDPKSEFATKWINLCAAHLGDTGITDPIVCYEYLGNFYVQEGNKRVSVLRHFDAPRIPGTVKRILPPQSDEPRIRAYYEFVEFYKASRLYTIQFRRPGDYAKLLSYMGKKSGESWTEEERRTFNAYYHYFLDAFHSLHPLDDVLPEEALLLWLKLYPFQDLGRLSAAQLKKSLVAIREDVIASAKKEDSVKVQTKAEDESKSSLVSRIVSVLETLDVAFVHQLEPSQSAWVMGHEEGRQHIEEVFGDRIRVRSYYGANTPEKAETLIEQAVADGAEVIFTTAPPLSRATLKAAVKYPKIRFLNCSVDQPYSSIRTYYGRIYESKFITGAIAGAMAQNDRIGYIASYPIFGVTASINAFALGAQMTNPRAQIELRWSCCEGTPQADFFADGIRVISNRNAPTQSKMYLDFCNYGTYLMDDRGDLVPLGTPIWVWGKFYEFVIRAIFSGGWKREKGVSTALNYWLGMDSGVIDVNLSDKLPEGVRQMALLLKKGLADSVLDPFLRKIVAQDGTVKNDGTHVFTPGELLKMDWLCSNVAGSIPPFEEILPVSQNMVRELGLYRDSIPAEKESRANEDFDHLR
ncbi:MAG: BMP family ABC transporter substrate-binding protein [Oscillospiraceae bacterium]|nr:BMP family ABC transporter substrate-binding protein [Oscillospiraceae bacterium]